MVRFARSPLESFDSALPGISDPLGELGKFISLGKRAKSARTSPFKKLKPQLRLNCLHALGERGLREVQSFGGASDVGIGDESLNDS